MSRQLIAPGKMLETTTPAETAMLIARAFELQDVEEYERKKGVIQLDAAGAGTDFTTVVSAQYDWLLERITLGGGVASAANALVVLFENQQSDADMLEVIQLGGAGRYSDSFSNRIYLTANSKLVIAVSGGPALGSVTFNVQIRLKRHRSRVGR